MRPWNERAALPFVLIILIFGNALVASGGVAAASVAVRLHMVGEAPFDNGTTSVWVAGIWHQVTVNLTAFLNGGSLTVQLTRDGATTRNLSTAYEWVRNEANDSWYDALYGRYLRTDLSADQGISVTFGAGLDPAATPGAWTLEVLEGSAVILNKSVEVQAPKIAYGISASDFTFQVDPYVSSFQTSQATGQALQLTNQGNVPLGMGASFNLLQANLSLTDFGAVAHVGSVRTFYVRLALGPTPAELVEVNGTTGVFVAYAVPAASGAVLTPTFQQTFHVTITVGREGYHVNVVGNVVFQTLDTVYASYGSLVMWQVYLSGLQNVTLDVSVRGATLRSVTAGNASLALPASLSLNGSVERAIAIQITADQAGTATVTFTLHLLATGDTQTFVTSVPVSGGPADTTAPLGDSLLWLGGAIATVGIFGFIALEQLRHRAKRDPAGKSAAREGNRAGPREELGNHGTKRGESTQRKRTTRPESGGIKRKS